MSDTVGDDCPREEKQCRICLDGVEAVAELGKLIRPCLCRGSISVCIQISVYSSSGMDSDRMVQVRPCEVPPNVEEYISIEERFLLVPSMPLQLSLRPHSDSWLGFESWWAGSSFVDHRPGLMCWLQFL